MICDMHNFLPCIFCFKHIDYLQIKWSKIESFSIIREQYNSPVCLDKMFFTFVSKHLKTCLICLRVFVSSRSIENKPLARYNTLALLRTAQVVHRPVLHRGVNNLSCSPSDEEEWISISFICLLHEEAVNMECFLKWRS